MLSNRQVSILPNPPLRTGNTLTPASTTSHVSIVVNCSREALVDQLEGAIPRSFQFDTNSDGFRAYGNPSRSDLQITIDPVGRSLSASTSVAGRVQVEKRVKIDLLVTKIDELASVDVDVTGTIRAFASPEITESWSVQPNFDLTGQVSRAEARIKHIGGIDITGHVQGPVSNALNDAKRDVEANLSEMLDPRDDAKRIWDEMSSVHKIADSPPTWLRIVPRKVSFAGFQYREDRISSALALELETTVHAQQAPPDVEKTPLPNLDLGNPVADTFELLLPTEVSHRVLNDQLDAALSKQSIALTNNASITIQDVAIEPLGDGVLFMLQFEASQGRLSAKGKLYLVGIPALDVEQSELRIEQLEFSVETKNLLLKAADWLAHSQILDEIKKLAVFELEDELTKAKARANEELARLRKQLPKEIRGNVEVKNLNVDGIRVTKDGIYAMVKADGKMSMTIAKGL